MQFTSSRTSHKEDKEEKLRDLKKDYVKLFTGLGDDQIDNNYPSREYAWHFRRMEPFHRSNEKYPQEDRYENEVGPSKVYASDDKLWYSPSRSTPRLKLRPLLEDIKKRGPIVKRHFMQQRMDDLSGANRPTRILDYVRRTYPTTDNSAGNTFFLLGDVHKCIRDYLVGSGWVEKYCMRNGYLYKVSFRVEKLTYEGEHKHHIMGLYDIINSAVSMLEGGQEERSHMIRSLQGLPTGDNRSLGRVLATDPVKFIWVNGFINWSFISNNVIVSRIPSSNYYFSKTALASSIRDLFPFLYLKGTVDVQTPRTFEVRQPEDMKHFVKQYRINACISLLRKFLLTMESGSHQKLFSEDGTVPLDSMDFAVQRIVEVIRYHQHADLDEWHFSVVSDEDWNVFIFRFYDVIHQDAKFQVKHHTINISKLTHTCGKLCMMYEKCFPETKHDGFKNLWIVKPSNGSCGRGVRVFKRLVEIQQYCKPTNAYVIQKYIENPLLIYHTKFDIRQWFLITSVYPLVIWMYDECYLRFCSQQFSLTNVHESVHLCNNSIQYKYKNGTRSSYLPEDNMWEDGRFQAYLRDRDGSAIWPMIKNKMKNAIIASCLVSQDKMYHRTNSFHLYGADFMVTSDYDVWLIEINTHPSMKYSTSVTTRMCKEVLQDTLKVGLDRRSNPHADTGKFVEIYRQQSHLPSVGVPASAAGVHARKIRLLNQAIPKESSSSKPFEETAKTPTKGHKWLSYQSIASYKKHNKVNFKYVVLRHTEMPLDPGDGLTQRDIGYAGVLDKISLTDNVPENKEEPKTSEEDFFAKEKSEINVTKHPPKTITLHRKVIAKLKTKEKIVSNKSDTDDDMMDIISSKSIGNMNSQNTNDTEDTSSESITEAKQNLSSISIIDNMSYRSKPIQDDVHGDTFDTPSREKSVVSKKKMTSESLMTIEKAENSKKLVNSKQSMNSEKVQQSENALNKTANLTKAANSQRKFPVKNKIKVRNIIPADAKDKIKNVKNKEYSSKTNFTAEQKQRNASSTKNNNIPKINYTKQSSSTKMHRKPSNTIEKIVSEKLRTESINFINISKNEKEINVPKNQRNSRNNKTSEKNPTSVSNLSTSISKVTASSTKQSSISRRGNKVSKQAAGQQKSNTVNPTSDSTRINKRSINLTSFSKKKNISPIEIIQESEEEESLSLDLNSDAEGGDFILQTAFVPQKLVFMMSDSDISFKTAENISSDELSDELSFSSIDKGSVESEKEPHEPPILDNMDERINTNSIKRYKNRNKYCE